MKLINQLVIVTTLLTLFTVQGLFHANAAIIEIDGDTSNSEKWNRALATGSDLSSVGTATRFFVHQFSVSDASNYNFEVIEAANGFDTFMHLYENIFDPTDQLTNFLVGNDDGGDETLSRFSETLNINTDYFLVISGFNNTDFGTYTVQIDGDGDINLANAVNVSGPATTALFGLGLFVLAFTTKRD